MVSHEKQHEREQMPKYLSHAEKTFEEIITPLLPQPTAAAAANNTILIEELRQMALLEHKLQLVNLDISLWTTYLKSGTGKLKEEEEKEDEEHRSLLQQLQQPRIHYPCIWPKKLKSIITADPDVHLQEKTTLGHSTYLNYVNRMLVQFQDQLLSYQTQIKERRQHLTSNLTPEIEQAIVNFVEEYGITLESIVNEGLITAVKFNYADRMIELEFQREDTYREHVCTLPFVCIPLILVILLFVERCLSSIDESQNSKRNSQNGSGIIKTTCRSSSIIATLRIISITCSCCIRNDSR